MSKERSIFITGASSGFGRDAALQLAERGHTVVATMRGLEGKNVDNAGEMRRQAETNDWSLHLAELDVTDQESVDRAVRFALENAGGIDVLINNAGVGTFGVQEGFTVEQVQQVFDVNVFGVHRVNRAALPHMRERGSGHVIYLSSGLGRFVFPFVGPYAGTKFALEAMAESAAYELQSVGIDTTIVEPGAFGTAFGAKMIQAQEPERLQGYGAAQQQFESMAQAFAEREYQDPQLVVDALVELAESNPGERPLRRPVGVDSEAASTPINEAQARSQAQIMKHFGFD